MEVTRDVDPGVFPEKALLLDLPAGSLQGVKSTEPQIKSSTWDMIYTKTQQHTHYWREIQSELGALDFYLLNLAALRASWGNTKRSPHLSTTGRQRRGRRQGHVCSACIRGTDEPLVEVS